MKIDKRDIYSFLIAVMVVTITSIIQIENPISEDKVNNNTAQTTSNNNSLAVVGIK